MKIFKTAERTRRGRERATVPTEKPRLMSKQEVERFLRATDEIVAEMDHWPAWKRNNSPYATDTDESVPETARRRAIQVAGEADVIAWDTSGEALIRVKRRLDAVKEVIVARMHEVEPCKWHVVTEAMCSTCGHDLFVARLMDAVTT